MKIKPLIELLHRIRKNHGNLEIYFRTPHSAVYKSDSILTIFVEGKEIGLILADADSDKMEKNSNCTLREEA